MRPRWAGSRGKRLASAAWLLLGVALVANGQTLATSGRVSTTAEAVCVLRAIAAKHPDSKIRNPDYLAEKLVSAEFWRTSPFRDDPDRARHNPNYFWVNARTHHMDALLVEALARGATQVVNLGAGLDSRPAGVRAGLPDSLLIVRADGSRLVRSTAVLYVGERMGELWRVLALFARVVPTPLRDAAYDGVARARHRLFTRPTAACPVLPVALRARFDG
jgi:hypothetical protein